MGVTAARVAVGVRQDHLENDAEEEHRSDTFLGLGFEFGFGFRFRFGLGSSSVSSQAYRSCTLAQSNRRRDS